MLVSYRWLKEYVDIPWEPSELAKRLTMAGLEVEGLREVGPALEGVYVGLLETVSGHPQAGKLTVCLVDVGRLGKHTVVCGAPNAAAGQKVAIALPGASLPAGLHIQETTIQGVVSEGMICSLKELGLGADHEGILVLPKKAEVGSSLSAALDLDDVILDVTVYANRPDCMSMIGIAREVAALTEGEIRLPSTEYTEMARRISDCTSVVVEDPTNCPRYTATLAQGVEVGPSPLWMQLRLEAAGMRAINNVVDITNYVMLETGQPLHAFDFDNLAEKRLVVRGARTGESIVTLDGVQRELTSEMLLICDAYHPKCIAGVMGGADSEVKEGTSTVLLEAANFAPVSVRRTSRALGLSSESSARFEKGIDAEGTVFASMRAAHLLQALAGAEIAAGRIDEYTAGRKGRKINLRAAAVAKLLGVQISPPEIEKILGSLGFNLEKQADGWRITPPSHRGDLEIEADIIEEIVRIWGFDRIPATLPTDRGGGGGQSKALAVADHLRAVLVGAGLQEALTYTFGRRDNNERLLRFNRPMIEIQNPISEELKALRQSLLPGLLSAVSLNASRQQQRVALFEIGAVYLGKPPLKELPQEQLRLGIVLWGDRAPKNWGLADAQYDFYDLKGILELLLPGSPQLQWGRGTNNAFHPGRQGTISWQGTEIARYGEIHPIVLRNFKAPRRCLGAEVDLGAILGFWDEPASFRGLPKYPAIERDLAIVVDQRQPVGELIAKLQEVSGVLLQAVTVFDVYQGKPIPAGKKSIAFSLRFQGDRTLVDEEVTAIMEQCVQALHSQFGAEIR